MDLDEFRIKLWEQSRSEFKRRCMERELREMTDDQELATNWHNALHEEEGWFAEQDEAAAVEAAGYSWRNPDLSEEERQRIEAFISGLLVRAENSGCGRTDRPCCGGGCSR